MGGILGGRLAVGQLGSVLSIANPYKSNWKKVIPAVKIVQKSLATGAKMRVLQSAKMDNVLNDALGKFLKLKRWLLNLK